MDDRKPDESGLLAVLAEEYGLCAVQIAYFAAGADGHVWRVQGEDGPLCVKAFHRLPAAEAERRAALTCDLRDRGLPFPRVVPTAAGAYTASFQGHGLQVSGWIDGTMPTTMSPATASVAGIMLGRLHLALRLGGDGEPPWEKPSWRPCTEAMSETATMLERVAALPDGSDLDLRVHQALDGRGVLLEQAEVLAGQVSGLARQIVHGDYTRGNLMFREGGIVGLIDLIGCLGSPVWELARIAFEPQSVAQRSDWLDVAAETVRGYRSVCDLSQEDAVVKVAALYHLSSSWGVLDRYPAAGGVTPTGNERYWLNRQLTARLLLENLTDVESRVLGAA